MKRLTIALGVSTCLLTGSLYADHEGKDKTHYSTELKAGQQIQAKHLLGARVNDAQGAKIGQVEDLVIDPTNPRNQFAVVRLSSDLVQANKAYTPIPLAALRPQTVATSTADQPKNYVLTVDRSKLQGASRFNVERWPADQNVVVWGPEVYSHYGMTAYAGAPSSELYVQSGEAYIHTSTTTTTTDRGLEHKDTVEPPTDFREKSVDNGTAPDGKTTFPFLHEQTDQD